MLCKGSHARDYTQSVTIVTMDAPSAVANNELARSQAEVAALTADGVFELAARFPAVAVPCWVSEEVGDVVGVVDVADVVVLCLGVPATMSSGVTSESASLEFWYT